MNKYLKKIILSTGLGVMLLLFTGCSETDLIIKYRSVSNAEIVNIEKVKYRGDNSRTCIKTNKGDFFISNSDYLNQIKLYYDYKKTEGTKPIVSFIYNSNSYEETEDEKIYYINSIAFNDNLEPSESEIIPTENKNTSTQNTDNNDISKYGITINNSIDTNTNTSVNNGNDTNTNTNNN